MQAPLGAPLLGKVEECSGSFIGTEFQSFVSLPLYPVATYVVLHDADLPKHERIDFHPRSVLFAYLNSWGIILAGLGFLVWAASRWRGEDNLGRAGLWAMGALLVIALRWLFSRGASLGRDGKAQRLAFKDLVGHAVDPLHLGVSRATHRRRVREEVLRHARAHAAEPYRNRYEPERQWDEMALDAEIEDPRFLVAAMTLARIEQAYTKGVDRARYGRAARGIWRRLRKLAPEYYEAAAYA
jgi:hypothetical protein